MRLAPSTSLFCILWTILSSVFFAFLINACDTQTEKKSVRTEKMLSGNPIVDHIYTADPAGLVYKDTLFVYTGHDEQVAGKEGYVMDDWHVFSTTDMVNWKDHGEVLTLDDFDWAVANAWAGECVFRDGKFWWYVPMSHKKIHGFSIGVAVSDHPTGPFKDARGSALITNDMTTDVDISWDDIDPTVFVDDDGAAWLFWGNTKCYYARLKDNMTELASEIDTLHLPNFTEAPYIHKTGDTYYLTYAAGFPETIDYATSNRITGPWKYQGRLNDTTSSTTNHQSIVKFKGNWYFIYHTADLPGGGNFRRSFCIDSLHYNRDGSLQEIKTTRKGVNRIN